MAVRKSSHMMHNFNSFQSLLEARTVDWTYDANKDAKDINGETLTRDLVELIFEADPTRNKAYVNWMLRCYRRTQSRVFQEDLYRMHRALEVYDRVKRQLDERDRNIMNINSLHDLEDLLAPFFEDAESTLSKRQLRGDSPVEGEYRILYENDTYSIIIPLTYRASCYFGSGTEWCTALSNTDHYYRDYTSSGPLYIIYDHKENKPVYQFHYERGHFMGIHDRPIDMQEFYDQNPDLRAALEEDVNNRHNRVDSIGPLLNAIRDKNVPEIDRLFRFGVLDFVPPYRDFSDNSTILHVAAKSRSIEVFNKVIDNIPENILRSLSNEVTSNKGETVLISLVKNPGIHQNDLQTLDQCFRRLIRAGARINSTDRSGATAFLHAIMADNMQLIDMLLDNGADATVVYPKKHDATAFHLIAESSNYLEIGHLQRLLDAGCDVNAKDSEGSTALQLISKRRTMPNSILILAKFLLDNGCDPNNWNNEGKTALQYAMVLPEMENDDAFIRLLLNSGADVNMVDSKGNTPLHALAAFKKRSTEVLQDMLNKGADVTIQRATDGKTPLDVAKTVNNKKFTQVVKNFKQAA